MNCRKSFKRWWISNQISIGKIWIKLQISKSKFIQLLNKRKPYQSNLKWCNKRSYSYKEKLRNMLTRIYFSNKRSESKKIDFTFSTKIMNPKKKWSISSKNKFKHWRNKLSKFLHCNKLTLFSIFRFKQWCCNQVWNRNKQYLLGRNMLNLYNNYNNSKKLMNLYQIFCILNNRKTKSSKNNYKLTLKKRMIAYFSLEENSRNWTM